MTRTKSPALFQLLAGYFHEDWTSDHEEADDVLKLFLSETSDENLFHVKVELKTLLRSKLSEEQLEDFLLEEIGCSYYYPSEWSSGRTWLEHVLDLLSRGD
ncbi:MULTISPECIES: contact-dependent growth inhibition system immunity protein [unclassified Pseudomonas]|uniref:contact-dependent growth inhibition system immunity protein n=1 Tax=unclassified Pseudomonas TaxID=196821 RepID=UPI000A1EF416|nr:MULTISPECIES: contact-dependent growth inhibition system immunity protein [unclassified Pseudomonas]